MSLAQPVHTALSRITPRHCRRVSILIGLGAILGLALLSQLPLRGWPRQPEAVSRQTLANFPEVIVWAWERPESLHFVDPHAVGVAFLARTLYLSGSEVIVRPRFQPLTAPEHTQLMAVVRLEADRLRPPDLSLRQRQVAAAAVAEMSGLEGIRALQIDFDAAASQRAFYRALLHDVRRQLPASMPLSMTALASWCIYDDWLADLPVDEVVPMVFRMGADQHRVRGYLADGDFRVASCRHGLGISTDEPLPALRAGRRLYIFHPRPWRRVALTRALEEVRRWPVSP